MNIDVFKEAQAQYDKYQLCEKVLEYLSDAEKVRGLKYKELLSQFVETFNGEFMIFVHERMTEAGMAFEEIGKCNCENCPSENEPIVPPAEEPKEPKFAIGSLVQIVNGVYVGKDGVVRDFNPADSTYYVVGPLLSMWMAEDDLKLYYEESEETENPAPEMPPLPWPEYAKFKNGDRIVTNGNVGTIIGYDYSEHKYGVLLDSDDEETKWLAEDELKLYTESEGDGTGDSETAERE